MSRSKYLLDTPAGKVRTVMIDGARFYVIKDVCAGIGLTGHSPWSWHAKEAGNKELFYRRYDLNRRCATSGGGRRNTATVITYNGLIDYLSSATIRKKPQAVMFKTWLESQVEIADPSSETETLLEQQEIEIPTSGPKEPENMKAPQTWRISYVCPFCEYTTRSRSKFCPECGSRLD